MVLNYFSEKEKKIEFVDIDVVAIVFVEVEFYFDLLFTSYLILLFPFLNRFNYTGGPRYLQFSVSRLM